MVNRPGATRCVAIVRRTAVRLARRLPSHLTSQANHRPRLVDRSWRREERQHRRRKSQGFAGSTPAEASRSEQRLTHPEHAIRGLTRPHRLDRRSWTGLAGQELPRPVNRSPEGSVLRSAERTQLRSPEVPPENQPLARWSAGRSFRWASSLLIWRTAGLQPGFGKAVNHRVAVNRPVSKVRPGPRSPWSTRRLGSSRRARPRRQARACRRPHWAGAKRASVANPAANAS
jgi:hypothetical protein